MHFGAAWYPEHWPESRWPVDLKFMKQANFTVVRVAEFAWSTMEPADGKFEFRWLDRAVDLAGKAGLKVVIGTPSAAPPAWLTSAHPETLRVHEDGRRAEHGGRCHFRPLSPKYLRFCERIVDRMAKRYASHPAVIGWQIDNEFAGNSHDAWTRRKFQDWLRVRYRTLDRLNSRWSGAYWSEDYQDWRQIQIPNRWHNPGLQLEWRRFETWTWRVFQKVQVRAIRKYAGKRQWITTDLMGFHGSFDQYEVMRDLDLAAINFYCPTGTPDPAVEAMPYAMTRGLKARNFWLTETQPSGVNWGEVNTMLEPGRVRARNWQAVAHGADAVLYWQWRNALGGQEQLHGSLIGQDGNPRPCFGELSQIGAEFAKAAPYLKGTTPRTNVALLNSYDARWAVDIQRHHKGFDWVRHFQECYGSLWRRNVAADIPEPANDLGKYRLVVAPALWLLKDDDAKRLDAFVRNGGHLLLTVRTGAKDAENALRPMLPPGPLGSAAGVAVEDFYALLNPVPVNGQGLKGRVKIWGERLRITGKGVKIHATFGKGNGWLEGKPAIVSRTHGKGTVWTLAGWLEPDLLDTVVGKVLAGAGIKPRFTAPKGVEMLSRADGKGREVVITINHADAPARMPAIPGRPLIAKRPKGAWTLAARDVEVFV